MPLCKVTLLKSCVLGNVCTLWCFLLFFCFLPSLILLMTSRQITLDIAFHSQECHFLHVWTRLKIGLKKPAKPKWKMKISKGGWFNLRECWIFVYMACFISEKCRKPFWEETRRADGFNEAHWVRALKSTVGVAWSFVLVHAHMLCA